MAFDPRAQADAAPAAMIPAARATQAGTFHDRTTSLAANGAAAAVTSPRAQSATRSLPLPDFVSMARVTAVHMNQRRR